MGLEIFIVGFCFGCMCGVCLGYIILIIYSICGD